MTRLLASGWALIALSCACVEAEATKMAPTSPSRERAKAGASAADLPRDLIDATLEAIAAKARRENLHPEHASGEALRGYVGWLSMISDPSMKSRPEEIESALLQILAAERLYVIACAQCSETRECEKQRLRLLLGRRPPPVCARP